MSRSFGLSPELEAYVRSANREEHPVLQRCRDETTALGDLAVMQISPEQGAFLQLMARMVNARDALEIGVFTGYSATAVALAMQDLHGPEARLVACDVSEEYLGRALVYFEAAGVSEVIEPRIGPGTESLEHLLEAGEGGAFDFAFVDADKPGYADYYERIIQLLRPGGVMLFDNVLWSGDVADLSKTDANTTALRSIAEKARADARVETAFTTIGDGLLICVKR